MTAPLYVTLLHCNTEEEDPNGWKESTTPPSRGRRFRQYTKWAAAMKPFKLWHINMINNLKHTDSTEQHFYHNIFHLSHPFLHIQHIDPALHPSTCCIFDLWLYWKHARGGWLLRFLSVWTGGNSGQDSVSKRLINRSDLGLQLPRVCGVIALVRPKWEMSLSGSHRQGMPSSLS